MKKITPLIWLLLPSVALSQDNFKNTRKFTDRPLIEQRNTSNPSVHVFNHRLYIYCSQDAEGGVSPNRFGDQFAMRDYWLYRLDSINGPSQEIGQVLDIREIPWAGRQLWAQDVTYHKGVYFLYFTVKDKNDVFRIGVATSDSIGGPYKPEKNPISLAYSIDPRVFRDEDGSYYLLFGGIKNGQLHQWENNVYRPNAEERTGDQYALLPRIARLSPDMKQLAEKVREIKIVNHSGELMDEKENKKRFGESASLHQFNGKYYLTYSTGETRMIVYAIGSSPYGPFTYRGILKGPIEGTISHHSIVHFKGSWYLFYHDSRISGLNHLRHVYVTPITHLPSGEMAIQSETTN
jgi:hypothetical protein